MDVSLLIAQQAIVRQEAAMSMLKQASDAQKQVADILAQALDVSPSGRGESVNLTA